MNKREMGLLVIGLALFWLAAACGDEGGFPGIYLGETLPTYSAADVVDDAHDACVSGVCDGEFEAAGGGSLAKIAPPADMDLSAAFSFLINPLWELWYYSLSGQPEFWETINEMESPTGEFTFSLSQTVNCNSTATGGAGLGTPDDGIIENLFVFTATFGDDGNIEWGEHYAYSQTVTFLNCLIAGDILDLATAPQIRINGSLVRHIDRPETVTTANPERGTVTGTLSLSTDKDGDDTFDDPFWGENVNANAGYEYDGDIWTSNGGICIGSTVQFGEDPNDDDDDDCATDPDDLPEGFIQADYCPVFGC